MNKKVGFTIHGYIDAKCYDSDGNLKWEDYNHNTVTTSGILNLLDVYFHDAAQTSTWYIGLKGTGAEAAGDTMASHAGWSEVTDYADNRKEFEENAAATGAISNTGNAASFAINGDATVAGAFVCGAATGDACTLWCVEDFASSRTVANGDKSCCHKTSLKTVKPNGMSLWQRCAKLIGNNNERPETDITLRSLLAMGSCEAYA